MNENTQDIGGAGEKKTGEWYAYQAYRTVNNEKVPSGKIVQRVKLDSGEYGNREYDFVTGLLDGVSVRLNKGAPDKGVEAYEELLVSLLGRKNGEEFKMFLPLRASSTAAMSVMRRLPNLDKGDVIEIGAFVSQGQPNISVQRIEGGNRVKIEAVDAGLQYTDHSTLTGAKKTAAQNQNAVMREEWVIAKAKTLPYYADKVTTSPAAFESYEGFNAFCDDIGKAGWPDFGVIPQAYLKMASALAGEEYTMSKDVPDAVWSQMREGVAKAKAIPKALQEALAAATEYDPFAE